MHEMGGMSNKPHLKVYLLYVMLSCSYKWSQASQYQLKKNGSLCILGWYIYRDFCQKEMLCTVEKFKEYQGNRLSWPHED